MPNPRRFHPPRDLAVVSVLALLALAGFLARAATPRDPLAEEIARWTTYVKSDTSSDDLRKDMRESATPLLEAASGALAKGRRLFAVQRLGSARSSLAAALHAGDPARPAAADSAGFEAEWARLGREMRADLGAPRLAAVEGIRPAAVRAMAEAALPQVRIYYDASLEYGRNTMPLYGRFYLGLAEAQREWVAFCRTLEEAPAGSAPPLRPLGPELDALEHEILLAYRPPLSIDRHPEFIGASALLKEARELDAAGLRYGALHRYLQASLRFHPLRAAAPAPDSLARRLEAFEARLAAGGVDHSIARLQIETARAELAAAAPGAATPNAAAIVADALPRYFAALEPARPAPAPPAASVTVTLVRWPYT